MSATRTAAVAGMFYPGEQTTLARELLGMLDETRDGPLAPGFPKALVVPPAGYIYSLPPGRGAPPPAAGGERVRDPARAGRDRRPGRRRRQGHAAGVRECGNPRA